MSNPTVAELRWAAAELVAAMRNYTTAVKAIIPVGTRVRCADRHSWHAVPWNEWNGKVVAYPMEHDGTIQVMPDEPESHYLFGTSLLHPRAGVAVHVDLIEPLGS